jgi:hypothetical protein
MVFSALGEHFIVVAAVLDSASIAVVFLIPGVPAVVLSIFPEGFAIKYSRSHFTGGLNFAGGLLSVKIVALMDPAVVEFIISEGAVPWRRAVVAISTVVLRAVVSIIVKVPVILVEERVAEIILLYALYRPLSITSKHVVLAWINALLHLDPLNLIQLTRELILVASQ